MSPPRPRPRLDADNRAFWTGGAEGNLYIMRCSDCGKYTHPPRQICRHCQSESMSPHAARGTGQIDSYTINYQPWFPGLDVPFVIARVRLDGIPGVYLTTNIVGSPVESIKIDDPVRVVFEEQDGIWFPLFQRTGD
jgi:uncharacterized OB-fold protein